MTGPLSDEQLARIHEQVQTIHDRYREESASAAEVALAIDTQLLLDAYASLSAENAAFRPIVEAVAEATVLTHHGFASGFFCKACGAWLKDSQNETERGKHSPDCIVTRARVALERESPQ
jgi:hypothetical protein